MGLARVVVVGSSNTDMVVKAARIPRPGETLLGGSFLMVPGGKGANQAVAAARLGAHVSFVGRVGCDVFGDAAVASLADAGVDTRFVARDPDVPSGVALICVDDAGQNSIVVAPGSNACVSGADVEAARSALEAADVIVAQFEMPLGTVGDVLRLAGALGKPVVVNPAPAQAPPPGLLRGVTVLTPNEVEAATLVGARWDADFDAAAAGQALLEQGVGAVVVTVGAEGAIVCTPGATERIPALPVEAMDTTAAGDCFTGALACAMGEGRGLAEAVRFATAAAALSVTRMGAQPSLPGRVEVDALYA